MKQNRNKNKGEIIGNHERKDGDSRGKWKIKMIKKRCRHTEAGNCHKI